MMPFVIKQKIIGVKLLQSRFMMLAQQQIRVGIHVKSVTNFMSSSYIRKVPPMIVKCWNCGTDFEHVSSARDSNKISATHIAEVLRSNIFDANRGTVLINVDDLIDEIAEVIVNNV
jgi:hypothetical protein